MLVGIEPEKERRDCFPEKIIDDRARSRYAAQRSTRGHRVARMWWGMGRVEWGEREWWGWVERSGEGEWWGKNGTSPVTRVPRCSSTLVIQSKQSITHLLSRPCTVYPRCSMAHEDFVGRDTCNALSDGTPPRLDFTCVKLGIRW